MAASFLGLLLLVSVVVWSLWYRRRIGKPIFVSDLGSAVVYATHASGYRRGGWPFRTGLATLWLVVALDDERLTIFPRFPSNVMFLGDLWDLDHVVPVADILSVEPRRGFLRHGVDVSFRGRPGETVVLTLYLRHAEDFASLLRKKAGIDFLNGSR